MCVTLHDARLGQTTIAGWRVPESRTHCLLYGNEPENRAAVANAMILHIPLAYGATLTRENFLPTAGLEHVLADMWAAAPKYQTRGFSVSRGVRGISVFDMGAYTWVTATQAVAADIAAALEAVRPDRRPQVSEQLIAFYRRTWPDDALAIGCFGRDASGGATEPACIQYPPQDWGRLRMPAVDAHGEIPDLRARVRSRSRCCRSASGSARAPGSAPTAGSCWASCTPCGRPWGRSCRGPARCGPATRPSPGGSSGALSTAR